LLRRWELILRILFPPLVFLLFQCCDLRRKFKVNNRGRDERRRENLKEERKIMTVERKQKSERKTKK
jgi:hypothetical protein